MIRVRNNTVLWWLKFYICGKHWPSVRFNLIEFINFPEVRRIRRSYSRSYFLKCKGHFCVFFCGYEGKVMLFVDSRTSDTSILKCLLTQLAHSCKIWPLTSVGAVCLFAECQPSFVILNICSFLGNMTYDWMFWYLRSRSGYL